MKLSITLPDPKYCNGCPCHHVRKQKRMCEIWYMELDQKFDGFLRIIRPQICKDKNGE
jgi:hypothetical protein